MSFKSISYWIVLAVLAMVLFYSQAMRTEVVAAGDSVALNAIPLETAGWSGTDFYFEDNVLDVLRAEQTLFRRYINDTGTEVWLFIGYWRSQKYGAQPHSPLHCLPGSGWNFVSSELIPLSSGATPGSARKGEVNHAIITNNNLRQSMLYWYQTRNGYLSKELSVKIDLARNALLRQPTDVAFIRLTSVSGSTDGLEAMRLFWSEIQSSVQAALPF